MAGLSLGKSNFKKFSFGGNQEDKRKVMKVTGGVFLLILFLIGVAILSRELPVLSKKINQSELILSERREEVTPTATPAPKYFAEKEKVLETIRILRGKYGVWFEDLETGGFFEINGREKMTAASLIKLPVMLALYREAEAGRINLDEVYQLKAEDKVGGGGSLYSRPEGYQITFRQMAELMGKQSDNTAFNIVVKRLGKEKIQNLIDSLGMRGTSFEENLTTPEDMALFFRKLYKENLIYEKDREEILGFLTQTIWEDRIPAGVPAGVRVSHKIGTEAGVISDAGIVFGRRPFILVIMSEGVNKIEAKKALPEITRQIYEMTQN